MNGKSIRGFVVKDFRGTGALPVRGHVAEQILILRRRVFRAVRRWEGHDHHNGLVGKVMLRLAQECQTVVDNQIGIVVELVVVAVLHFVAVHVNRVVVVARVANKGSPLAPARRYIAAVVLVQIFAEKCCN